MLYNTCMDGTKDIMWENGNAGTNSESCDESFSKHNIDVFVKLTSYGTVGRNFRYALPVTVTDELLSETWLGNESDISVPNFNCIVKYKRPNTRAEGVAIYQNSSDAVNIITPSTECSVSQSDIYVTILSSVGDLCLAECVIDNGQKL
ncbi:hypothetical protein TNCV_3235821 [Trichonephila clavipes]|nr:hypothetical protein TNCV_3235821 [Trichonephila clavipes]